jgi:hypothetical protein
MDGENVTKCIRHPDTRFARRDALFTWNLNVEHFIVQTCRDIA